MIKTVYTAALVGCGRIGYSLGLDKKREQPASHTMALNGNDRIKLIAGCDTDEEKAAIWHEANKECEVFASSSDLYASFHPDIITVAVNESFHKEEALKAIVAKPKLLILEKPVALNTSEAKEIYEYSVNFDVPVLINHERRFAEDYKAAKKYMSQIGDIQNISASLCSSMCVYNSEEESTGAYSLIHDGTHLVDAVEFFLNDEPLAHPIVTGVWRDENKCVRQLNAHFSNEKCPDISIAMSGRSKFFSFEIIINGTLGRICLGNGFFKLYKRGESPFYTGFYSLLADKAVHVPRQTLYFANMIQNAVDFLDGKASLRSTVQTGMQDLAVLEDIKSCLL
ncbi:MAG: Gfo/Idh/MocA family oxidoreductase [Treponema sp.]|nr:Gfo/Idh/MocA family oxidoreductase [Treponema sp.]